MFFYFFINSFPFVSTETLSELNEKYTNWTGWQESLQNHFECKELFYLFIFSRCLFWFERYFGCTKNHDLHKNYYNCELKWKNYTLHFLWRMEKYTLQISCEKCAFIFSKVSQWKLINIEIIYFKCIFCLSYKSTLYMNKHQRELW